MRQSPLSIRIRLKIPALLAPTKLGPCCRVEPIGGIGVDLTVIHQREVSLISKRPKNASVAGAIGIIHLDEPVLVTDRDEKFPSS